jgi:2-polyprenyl-3-methyl-5-hydroxy-6-metoxy-1,4-benzoquinol methylase
MQEIDEICPNCSTSNWIFLYHSAFNNYSLPIFSCSTCKLQTIFPKENVDLNGMYNEDYYSGKAEYNYIDERNTEKYSAYVWDARIKNIKKFVNGGNFLDIGSSFGGFLRRASLAGFTVFGAEVSKFSSDYANSKGITTFNGTYIDNKYPESFFSVITLVEVIEHLEFPSKVFEKLYSQLTPGGLLLIQTANFEGKQAIEESKNYHYYLPGHLYYYSKTNLESILKQKGFSRIKTYLGVDFPLLPKLLKSRGSYKTVTDYLNWWKISKYHLKSKLFPGSTSSMVIYAIK